MRKLRQYAWIGYFVFVSLLALMLLLAKTNFIVTIMFLITSMCLAAVVYIDFYRSD